MIHVGTGLLSLLAFANLRFFAVGLFLPTLDSPDFDISPVGLQFHQDVFQLFVGYWDVYPALLCELD